MGFKLSDTVNQSLVSSTSDQFGEKIKKIILTNLEANWNVYFYNRRRQVKNKEGTITEMVRIWNSRVKI